MRGWEQGDAADAVRLAAAARLTLRNPNPCFCVGKDGELLYANAAGDGLLAGWGSAVGGPATQELAAIAAEALAAGVEQSWEAGCGDRLYAFRLLPEQDARVCVYGLDVTDIREVAEAVTSLARFPDENPNPIMRVTAGGEIGYANRVASELMASFIKSDQRVVLPSELVNVLLQAFDSGEPQEVEIVHADDTFALTFAPVADEAYANIYGYNITSQHRALVSARNQALRAKQELEGVASEAQARAEELEALNAELDQFAYVASHDLRAPLRAIDSLAQWIAEDLDDSHVDAQHNLQMLRQRVQRMTLLLGSLLEYSRVGRKGVTLEVVDCAKLVRDIVDMLGAPPGFTITVGAAMPVLTTARGPLERVLLNLIGNAVKHHDRDDGHIAVAAEERSEHAWFRIRDDGPGIPLKHQERAFQMFQTLKRGEDPESSGMGLALIKKIVETAGGSITLTSQGRGATFEFSWPVTWRGKTGVD